MPVVAETELTDAAKGLLVEKGYDQKYGARPLKRALQKYVEVDEPESEAVPLIGGTGGAVDADVTKEQRHLLHYLIDTQCVRPLHVPVQDFSFQTSAAVRNMMGLTKIL